mmetsp:Transcript_50718/g.140713  ORF Transcript_50718/g.140713 Transcript_50718/m.140713 type:complete len:83 (+) Transcript_50718:249-497(+)
MTMTMSPRCGPQAHLRCASQSERRLPFGVTLHPATRKEPDHPGSPKQGTALYSVEGHQVHPQLTSIKIRSRGHAVLVLASSL